MARLYLIERNKSLKQRLAVSHALKGKKRLNFKPWNKGLKGLQPYHNISGLRPNPDTQFKKGEGGFNKKHSLETRIKISKSQQKGSLWTGFKNNTDYLERRRFQQTIQKQVFERDNYTCQLCEIRGVDLQVDHIQSWADYVELRFSLDNCRTLCAKCHYKITFGREMPKTVKGWGHNLLRRVNP